MRKAAPVAIRRAGLVVIAEGVAGVGMAAVLVALGIAGHDHQMSFGTALWFGVIGGGVLAAGWALRGGRRWGRGIAVFANLLLLPVSWYMAVGSHRLELGVPLAVVAVSALAMLFSPAALRWAAGEDQPSAGAEPASSPNAGPDNR